MKNLSIITLQQPAITDFAQARNQALSKAKTPWVLFLDQDEVLTPQLLKEIEQEINNPSNPYSAYLLKREDTFMSRTLRHGENGYLRHLRLAKKDYGRWLRPVHEVWVGQGRVGKLNHPLLHNPHLSISGFLAKIDHYSSLEAEYRYHLKKKSGLLKILFYPALKFKLNYFLRLGFLDGIPGLIMAIMMSFHSYLTWTKLYLLWHKK